ncbi:MAG: MerR family transcriptional regulator [Nitrospirae bacterium]|nr:MerR family transcriptional regulator [Nitrospirota bacterium]
MQKPHAKTIAPNNPLPDKLFYKIGEVSRITAVEPYVLRYWESEFPFLRPRKSKSGQRVYIKKDLETILEIKKLLYSERYTIEGVRKRFRDLTPELTALPQVTSLASVVLEGSVSASLDAIEQIKQKLRNIISHLV